MQSLKDRLPSFKSMLSPEERVKFEAMTLEERQAFAHALAVSLLIRAPLIEKPQTA